jgi:mannose-6-phosphate isomerase-like protein (cupin superfamily)
MPFIANVAERDSRLQLEDAFCQMVNLLEKGVAMSEVVSPKQVAASLTEFWSPRVIAEVDDVYVKVAKVKGVLTWHSHDNEDELFLILKGRLKIEMEDRTVTLNEGETFVVPKGVRHNPVAENECHLMLIERKSTLHTGDIAMEKTRTLDEQLRPV